MQSRESAAAAAVVQVTRINKSTYNYNYPSAMALLAIDLTYLKGKDGKFAVKELSVADSQSNRVSSYVFKKLYAWRYLRLTLGLIVPSIMDVTGMMATFCIQSWKLSYS